MENVVNGVFSQKEGFPSGESLLQLVEKPLLKATGLHVGRGSTWGRAPLRVESNACKKPAPAGVCA
ncbi:hypothetical protein, partial [Dysosmobacter sp.]|uniref:hypothetical protein n=1 Tax=Dysosmobacter sp. TaxID=2591382 RepID=UPI002DB74760